jgi:hypothetical protein
MWRVLLYYGLIIAALFVMLVLAIMVLKIIGEIL